MKILQSMVTVSLALFLFSSCEKEDSDSVNNNQEESPQKYACVEGVCEANSEGTFDSMAACEEACEEENEEAVITYECQEGVCVEVKGDGGAYSSQQQCEYDCGGGGPVRIAF